VPAVAEAESFDDQVVDQSAGPAGSVKEVTVWRGFPPVALPPTSEAYSIAARATPAQVALHRLGGGVAALSGRLVRALHDAVVTEQGDVALEVPRVPGAHQQWQAYYRRANFS
jgi:hypothetical protein